MEALGTEYVEVTWHSGARPSHQEWQGKVYRWNRGTGKSAKYKALGYDTVQVSSYGMCSETCKPWQGRVYIDDTFSGWTGETETRAEGVLWSSQTTAASGSRCSALLSTKGSFIRTAGTA